ncbi:hypothetical protein cypCar_00026825 [Cyprinus carpio]|nr:hypothetical protein cypCar_00026825 [Cyprinus carpio]
MAAVSCSQTDRPAIRREEFNSAALQHRSLQNMSEQRALKNPYPDYSGPGCAQDLFDMQGKLTQHFASCISSKISIALLYLHLHSIFGDFSFLQKALDYVSRSLRSLTQRWVTFLCGDAGPLAVAAVVYHRLQKPHEAEECVNRLLHLHQSVVQGKGRLPDELLYGRVGYLYSLIFINQQFQQEKIPIQYIQQICDAVLASGQNLSQRNKIQEQTPLMFEWYQEEYVGAAHGLSGIYYYLMQVFGVRQYLEDALHCGEVIWQRGLLKKGYGLCHGAAGNAYGFLALYKITQDPKHLYRACMFADWCMNYGKHGCRTPDTPFSLFEGMAGTIYFLADLLQPTKAKFPAFEV